ncbi:MAG: ABC transporter permease [Smithellaceae bacterium]|jgi:phospholipid/cholesterol/gamma-HCH transport system permease protein|nr:ABC transporter permease [Smithellaceae bacterium]MDD3259674.1 ABC transporter permease [Smithellaceae bacterium]MDD3849294.1 ABC transporter permease [Smithellaceae bacterium]HOE80010.1 ABC transporter permease [Smithellaceae bacterium]HOQ71778.1 ABC transporter permease [Smithellaceae bacterium]
MAFFEILGNRVIRMLSGFAGTIAFSWKVFLRIFQRKTYSSAMREVLVNQIYFTSVQILPLFLLVSIFFGSLFIGIVFTLLKELGLTQFIGHVLMGLIVTELSPFLTVLLITLRSSAAINTEMAVMKVNREIKTLEIFRIDIINYLVMPRIINGIISIVLLSSLFSIVLLASGILFSRVIFGMNMDVYSNLVLNSTDFSDIVISLCKCAVYGFFITLIPIRFGLRASRELTSIPVVVSQGMVNVFGAILMIEVLSLITKLL